MDDIIYLGTIQFVLVRMVRWSKIISTYGKGLIYYKRYLYSIMILDLFIRMFIDTVIRSRNFTSPSVFRRNEWITTIESSNNVTLTNNAFAEYVFYATTASYSTDTFPYTYAYLHYTHWAWFPLRMVSNLLEKNCSPQDNNLEDPFCFSESYLRNWKPSARNHDDAKLPEGEPESNRETNSNAMSFHTLVDQAYNVMWFKYKRNILSMVCFLFVLFLYGVCLWALQVYMYTYLRSKTTSNTLTVSIWVSLVMSSGPVSDWHFMDDRFWIIALFRRSTYRKKRATNGNAFVYSYCAYSVSIYFMEFTRGSLPHNKSAVHHCWESNTFSSLVPIS